MYETVAVGEDLYIDYVCSYNFTYLVELLLSFNFGFLRSKFMERDLTESLFSA